MKAKDRLAKSRIDLIAKYPFFGTLALRLKLVEMPQAMVHGLFTSRNLQPTMAVDGKTMWYYAPWVESQEKNRLMAGVAHEVGHCIYGHMGRRGNRNPNKWLAACDYVVNGMLARCGFDIDKVNWLYNEDWDDKVSAEYVYNLLPDNPKGGGGGGGGYPGGGDALDQMVEIDPDMNQASIDEWEMAVQQAAIAAKQAGKLPAHLERFIKNLLEPQIDWRVALRRFVTEVSRSDYSWARPNKYFSGQGIILPGLYSEQMGTLATTIDDSGSIHQQILDVFGSEVASITASVRPQRTYLLSCDARVNHVDEFTEFDPFSIDSIKVHGGGGTDFRPPFDYLEQHQIKPACMIYLTDGYGPFPKAPPDYPVLWCMITDVQAPWGQTIRIKL